MSFRGGRGRPQRGSWRGNSSNQSRGAGGPPPKRLRPDNDEEDERETFEDRLAGMLDDEEDMMIGDQDVPIEVEETIDCQQERFSRWRRPDPPKLDVSKDKMIFQQIDIDHYIGKAISGMPGAKNGPVPVMRMFGVTKDGNSICCHVHGFHPYFYVPAPDKFSKDNLRDFRIGLNNAVIADMKNNRDNVVEAVLDVQLMTKSTIYGFQGNKKIPYIKITMAVPKLIAPAKRLLEKGEVNVKNVCNATYRAFEANIDFEIRFMADTHVVGCNWIELPKGKYRLRHELKTRCQVELDVAWDDFISHAPEGDWSDVAPFRILSFDIECAGRKGIFPEADKDPVIQIANMVIKQGDAEPFIRNVFTLNTCSPIGNVQL